MPLSKNERRKLISSFKTAEDNMKWLVDNYDRLKEKYGDSWVATICRPSLSILLARSPPIFFSDTD